MWQFTGIIYEERFFSRGITSKFSRRMDKFVVHSPRKIQRNNSTTTSSDPECFVEDSDSASVSVISAIIPELSVSKQVNKTTGQRSFQKHRKEKYNWILYDEKSDRVFCLICKEVTSSSGFVAKKNEQDEYVMKTFVEVRFSTWPKALQRFASQEKSGFHIACYSKKTATDKGVNVHSFLCMGKVKEMKSAREALLRTVLPSVRLWL